MKSLDIQELMDLLTIPDWRGTDIREDESVIVGGAHGFWIAAIKNLVIGDGGDVTRPGAIRYNGGQLEVYNGSAWVPLSTGGSSLWKPGSAADAITPLGAGMNLEIDPGRSIYFGVKNPAVPHVVGATTALTLAGALNGEVVFLAGTTEMGRLTAPDGLAIVKGAVLGAGLRLGQAVAPLVAGTLSYEADKHLRLYDGTSWWQLDQQTAVGPAGGDLQGTYPNPTIKTGAVTRAKLDPSIPIVPAPVSPADDGQVLTALPGGAFDWLAPVPVPPTGPAGGELAGTYPNPQIKPGVITTAHISTIDWSKIVGVPAGFPPLGAAGGDLIGSSYPNPLIAAGKVTRAKTAPDCWLPPIPTGANVGQVLGVLAGPTLGWVAGGSGGGGDTFWTEDLGAQMLSPVHASTGVSVDSGSDGFHIKHSNPGISRRTGVSADDNALLLHAGQQSIQFKSWDSTAIWTRLTSTGFQFGANQGLDWGDVTAGPIPQILSPDGANLFYRGMQHFIQNRDGTNIGWFDADGLNLANAILTVAGIQPGQFPTPNPAAGSIQYDSTAGHLQAYIGGAWTQLDNQSGGGGGGDFWVQDPASGSLTPNTAITPSYCGVLLAPGSDGVRFRATADTARLTGVKGDDSFLYVGGGDFGTQFTTKDGNVSAQLDANGGWYPNYNGMIQTARTLVGGANNNINPGAFAAVTVSAPSFASITGFSGGVDGRLLYVFCTGAQPIDINSDNALSTAANRIQLRADQTYAATDPTLYPGSYMLLRYYGSPVNRWRVMTPQPVGKIMDGRHLNDYAVANLQLAPTCITADKINPAPLGADVGKVLTVDTGVILAWKTPTAAPSGNAGGDLSGTYPNPTVLKASGAFSVVGLCALAVTTASTFTATTVTATASNAIKWGNGTAFGHLIQGNASKRAEFTFNMDDLGAADDIALPSWRIRLGGATDDIQFNHQIAGPGAVVTLAKLAGDGTWTWNQGAPGNTPGLTYGTPTSGKFRIGSLTAGNYQFYSNATLNNLKDDTSLPSLAWVFDAPAREFGFYGAPAGSSITWSQMMALNATGLLLPAPGICTIPGNTSGVAHVTGAATIKGRVITHPTTGVTYLTANEELYSAASAWRQDDNSKPGWLISLRPDVDSIYFQRFGAGSGVSNNLWTLDSGGNTVTSGAAYVGGAGIYLRYSGGQTFGQVTSWVPTAGNTATDLAANFGQPLATRPTWLMRLDTSADNWTVQRQTGNNGGWATLLTLDASGFLTCNQLKTSAGRYSGGGGSISGDGYSNAIGFGWNGSAITARVDNVAPGYLLTVTSASDERVKTAIAEDVPGLDAVCAMRPITFEYTPDFYPPAADTKPATAARRHYGMIAQELAPVTPFVIQQVGDEPEAYLGVEYQMLVPVLVQAIKELAARVAALEAA